MFLIKCNFHVGYILRNGKGRNYFEWHCSKWHPKLGYVTTVISNFVTQNNFNQNFDPCHFEACHLSDNFHCEICIYKVFFIHSGLSTSSSSRTCSSFASWAVGASLAPGQSFEQWPQSPAPVMCSPLSSTCI